MFQRLIQYWRERCCKHDWRPGVMRGGLQVKVCDDCNKLVQLSVEEFYAQFGRIPRIGAA